MEDLYKQQTCLKIKQDIKGSMPNGNHAITQRTCMPCDDPQKQVLISHCISFVFPSHSLLFSLNYFCCCTGALGQNPICASHSGPVARKAAASSLPQ